MSECLCECGSRQKGNSANKMDELSRAQISTPVRLPPRQKHQFRKVALEKKPLPFAELLRPRNIPRNIPLPRPVSSLARWHQYLRRRQETTSSTFGGPSSCDGGLRPTRRLIATSRSRRTSWRGRPTGEFSAAAPQQRKQQREQQPQTQQFSTE